jgi:hypothetical protein
LAATHTFHDCITELQLSHWLAPIELRHSYSAVNSELQGHVPLATAACCVSHWLTASACPMATALEPPVVIVHPMA